LRSADHGAFETYVAELKKFPANASTLSKQEITQPKRLVSYHAPERRESVNLITDEQGRITERTVIAWREQDGKVGSSKTYDPTGKLKWTESYVYDENDNMMRIERRNPDGGIIIQTLFQHDESGKHIGTVAVDAEGNPVPPSEWEKYR